VPTNSASSAGDFIAASTADTPFGWGLRCVTSLGVIALDHIPLFSEGSAQLGLLELPLEVDQRILEIEYDGSNQLVHARWCSVCSCNRRGPGRHDKSAAFKA
jgi:hypothetical protein